MKLKAILKCFSAYYIEDLIRLVSKLLRSDSISYHEMINHIKKYCVSHKFMIMYYRYKCHLEVCF